MTTVRLGYTVGAGEPVEIPLKHMAICGQTQESGKTTTLEALITRAKLQAVTFVTKRGEGSFLESRRTPPYFREQADWQYVASVLEASRGEKLKFERAWIIRASKGARTLADVQANVRQALTSAKGLSADVYLTLDAYLDVVVPTISRVQWARELVLYPGVNAVDLTDIPDEMQHLVIRSCLEWVLKHEQHTVVVIPEAWKFLPQGRGTPVKLGAEAYIRQGAALGNYLWLDSQDLGGIEKTILRSVIVWVLGVQREANEIKRTLDNLPASAPRVTAADLASLELGQFYACWGRHAVKTYVQPVWMHDHVAAQVASGRPLDDWGSTGYRGRSSEVERHVEAVRVGGSIPPVPTTPKEDDTVNAAEADRLLRENADLTKTLAAQTETIAELKRRIEVMLYHGVPERRTKPRTAPDPPVPTPALVPPIIAEDLYQTIKARLLAEVPALITLLVTKPEIEVTVTRKTLPLDESTLKGRIAKLLIGEFFLEPRGPSAIRSALKRTGPDCNTANIGRACNEFVKDGFLTNEGSGYKAVAGVLARTVDGRL